MVCKPVPMLRSLSLPSSWLELLGLLRPVFARAGTFEVFVVLATGLVARARRRTVVGMLAGAGAVRVVSFHAACRFFSHAVWSADRLGLAVAGLVVDRLVPAGAPITVVIDDSLFKRWGPRVHHAFWTHDGAAQGPARIGRGNRWIIAGIVVDLPWCSHPVCLPVLLRLWAGKGATTPVQHAGELLALLAGAFPGRRVHGVGDAAYHGGALVVGGADWTTRLPANAALYAPAPPRTGKRGRPRLKGHRLGRPEDLAAVAVWEPATVTRYGSDASIEIAVVDALWYGAFGNTGGRVVLVRETTGTTTRGYALAVFTTDPSTPPGDVVARYAARWSIEVAIATGKQHLGVGQARNRVPRAVERTVPFGFIVQTLTICWYTQYGHDHDDVATRRATEPWYPTKTEPAFEDIHDKLRHAIIAARFTPVPGQPPDPQIIHDYQQALAAAAA